METGTQFNYTGTIVNYTVSATGAYDLVTFGAQGGSAGNSFSGPQVGGLGAEIGGDIGLTAGDQLAVLVGQAGETPTTRPVASNNCR